jgi:hypothetical protein
MPRLKCNIQFPQVQKGRWSVESPVGVKVLEESYENVTSISKDLPLTEYSAYILVDGGVSLSTGVERTMTQSLYIAVTPGGSIGLKNKFREKPTVITSPGASVALHNKFRTKVTVSVS